MCNRRNLRALGLNFSGLCLASVGAQQPRLLCKIRRETHKRNHRRDGRRDLQPAARRTMRPMATRNTLKTARRKSLGRFGPPGGIVQCGRKSRRLRAIISIVC